MSFRNIIFPNVIFLIGKPVFLQMLVQKVDANLFIIEIAFCQKQLQKEYKSNVPLFFVYVSIHFCKSSIFANFDDNCSYIHKNSKDYLCNLYILWRCNTRHILTMLHNSFFLLLYWEAWYKQKVWSTRNTRYLWLIFCINPLSIVWVIKLCHIWWGNRYVIVFIIECTLNSLNIGLCVGN